MRGPVNFIWNADGSSAATNGSPNSLNVRRVKSFALYRPLREQRAAFRSIFRTLCKQVGIVWLTLPNFYFQALVAGTRREAVNFIGVLFKNAMIVVADHDHLKS